VKKKALICGVSGQDGAYLAQLLLREDYEVYGSSRDAQMANFGNLVTLGIRDQVRLESVSPTDFRSVLQAVARIAPDEIYNLAGQSSVGLSFEQPVETLESISVATLNLLETIRFLGRPTRFYNACSGECFGDTGGHKADESTPFRPRSPYGVAKAAAFWEVANYRDAYGLFACSGLLFNHESPFRPARYVTKKVISGAARIAQGSVETLRLGNLGIARDWGWAPEYVTAMWKMLQLRSPQDYVIATGTTCTLEEFVDAAFRQVGLSWKDHVVSDPSLSRPSEVMRSDASPARARAELDWNPQMSMPQVVQRMMEAELRAAAARQGGDASLVNGLAR